MQAILDDGKLIPLEEITLDDVGWDKLDTFGNRYLTIYLSEPDLLFIGHQLFLYAKECIDDEPDYFEGEYRKDIPVPQTEQLFVEQPMLLVTYLENLFWTRETIVAILDLIGTTSPSKTHYWIQNFRNIDIRNNTIALEFGVHVKIL